MLLYSKYFHQVILVIFTHGEKGIILLWKFYMELTMIWPLYEKYIIITNIIRIVSIYSEQRINLNHKLECMQES